jgi:hypothetical protein
MLALEPLELWRDILLCEQEGVHIGFPCSYLADPIFSAELCSCGICRNHPGDLLQAQKILLTESPLCKANARRYRLRDGSARMACASHHYVGSLPN